MWSSEPEGVPEVGSNPAAEIVCPRYVHGGGLGNRGFFRIVKEIVLLEYMVKTC
jgi:hypothetical protein